MGTHSLVSFFTNVPQWQEFPLNRFHDATGTVTNFKLFTDYHSIAESQQKAIISSDATVSFIFLYLWGLFLTEYFTSALDRVNIATFSFKKIIKYSCFAFNSVLPCSCSNTGSPSCCRESGGKTSASIQTMWKSIAALVPLVVFNSLISEDCLKK